MTMLHDLLRTRNRKKDIILSKQTGIPPSRVDELSEGVEPNLEELRALADFFRIDLRDLLPPHPRHLAFKLLFRSGGRDVDDVTSSALSRRIGYSVELLGERPATRPSWIDGFSRAGHGYADAEANAALFRKFFWGDDQVSPLFGLADIAPEALGVLIFVVRNPRFEGASAYVEGLPFVFLAETFGPRMLFTLAHEIGHLIVHHAPNKGSAIVEFQT